MKKQCGVRRICGGNTTLQPGQMTIYVSTVFYQGKNCHSIDRPTATAVNLVPQDTLVVCTRKYLLTIRVQTHGCFRSNMLHKHVIRVHAITCTYGYM